MINEAKNELMILLWEEEALYLHYHGSEEKLKQTGRRKMVDYSC